MKPSLIVAGAGALVVGAAAYAYTRYDRNLVESNTEREQQRVATRSNRSRAEFERRTSSPGAGLLVAEAAHKLLKHHDLDGDRRLQAALPTPHRLSGTEAASNEFRVWSQHVWPWRDPELHQVRLVEHHAPRTRPVLVQDDSSWLRRLAGSDGVVSEHEIRSHVASFDDNGDGVLASTELTAFVDATDAAPHLLDGHEVDGPFTPVTGMATRLAEESRLAGVSDRGSVLFAAPPRYNSTTWSIERTPTRSEVDAGTKRPVAVAAGLTPDQVQAYFEGAGVSTVYHACTTLRGFDWAE